MDLAKTLRLAAAITPEFLTNFNAVIFQILNKEIENNLDGSIDKRERNDRKEEEK